MAITTNGGAGISADAAVTLTNKTLAAPVITGGVGITGTTTIAGDLTVTGTTTNINTTNLVVEDKNIVLADVASPTDVTADGGGITLTGATNKTLNWVDATDAWTSSEHFNLASGKSYYANGTLLKDVSETLTNKTLTTPVISSISNTGVITLPTATGTLALTSDITVTASSSTVFTTKSISLTTNTVTGTLAEFNTALSGDDFVSLTGAETLTNKTLTAPKINLSLNAQTGTTYTFVLGDNGQLVTASNASAQTYSIPTNASVAYPVGTQINIIQIGAGQVTIQAVTSGTTTVSSTGASSIAPKLRVQYSSATCIKVATDLWYVMGDIS